MPEGSGSFFQTPQVTPTVTSGGQEKLPTTSPTMEELLMQILFELKKINLHFELITDTEVKDRDIAQGDEK